MNKVSYFNEPRHGNSKQKHEQDGDDHEEDMGREARKLALCGVFPRVLRSAIELGLIDTLHVAAAADEDGGSYLSPSELSLRLPSVPTNPNAPDMLNRVLRLLACHSIVECRRVQTEDKAESVYRAKPICRFLVKDGDQDGSYGPFLLLVNDEFSSYCWSNFSEAILKGVNLFDVLCGMPLFEYTAKEKRFNGVFNKAMSSWSKLVMSKVIRVYGEFEGLEVLINVGGGNGEILSRITSKNPSIKAINLDLPHVVAEAPPHPRVEHIGGDMFTSIPKGDAIILSNILHDWNDEDCSKILKNCFKALPCNSKVIVVESVLPDEPKDDDSSIVVALEDVGMIVASFGGRARTRNEFRALATKSGFGDCHFICCAYGNWVMEFHKYT